MSGTGTGFSLQAQTTVYTDPAGGDRKSWDAQTAEEEQHFEQVVTSGAFQTGYIALRRALWSENNHGRHIEGSFQTEALKTGHFKGPFGMKDFDGYN